MKAIVLCAGEGTRLRPISFTGPKHLIPIANKPILIHIIEDIAASGIREVGVIINRRWEDTFREALTGTGKRWNIDISFIYQDEPRGLAHAAKTAQDFVAGDPFLMCLGDNLLQRGLAETVRQFEESGANALISLYEVDNPSVFGVAELDGEHVVSLEEKPKQPKSNWAIIGNYIFDNNVFDVVDTLKPSARGEYEITDAIQGLVDLGLNVAPHFVNGWWLDTGTADDMIQANRRKLLELVHKGQIDVGTVIWDDCREEMLPKGTQIINSEIRGPVIIGSGCRIEESFIGPFTSIGDGVTVFRSEIENSILLNECELIDFGPRLDKSIIGRRAKLLTNGDSHFTTASTFILADDSVVHLRRQGT
jgi:glucose-1-phosphate thymidylyltransferase